MNADFSSFPPAQEQMLVVFEQHREESAKKSLTAGVIGGVITFLLGMVLYFGFPPKEGHKAAPAAAPAAAKAPAAK